MSSEQEMRQHLRALAPAHSAKRPATPESSTATAKRPRVNNLVRCKRCRKDKKGCLPIDRAEGKSCDRCRDKGIDCPSGTRIMRGGGYNGQTTLPPSDDVSRTVDHISESEITFKDWQILLSYYRDLRLGLDQLDHICKEINRTFSLGPDFGGGIFEAFLPRFQPDVEQVHTVLKRSLSTLRSGDLFRAISEILAHDELRFLDMDGQEDVIRRLSASDQAYMQFHAYREKLRLHQDPYAVKWDGDWEETEREGRLFERHLSKLVSETNEVLVKFPELAKHRCTGALSLTPLYPGSEGSLIGIAGSDFQDCLGRTHLHRLLDQALPGDDEMDKYLKLLEDMLLDEPDSQINHRDIFDRTLLHLACQKGWVEGVRLLLEAEADPSVQTAWRSLPLHYAAAQGSLDICKLLLKYRDEFDVDEEDCIGVEASTYARNRGYPLIQGLLKSAHVSSLPTDSTSEQTRMDKPKATICQWIGCQAGDFGNLATLTAHVFSEHL